MPSFKFFLPILLLVLVLGNDQLAAQTVNAASSVDAQLVERIAAGRKVLEDRKKGNCLSCHLIIGAELPGNAGPPLIGMQARWPDREALKLQISNPALRNPETIMPPYGLHRILTEAELETLVDFIYSL